MQKRKWFWESTLAVITLSHCIGQITKVRDQEFFASSLSPYILGVELVGHLVCLSPTPGHLPYLVITLPPGSPLQKAQVPQLCHLPYLWSHCPQVAPYRKPRSLNSEPWSSTGSFLHCPRFSALSPLSPSSKHIHPLSFCLRLLLLLMLTANICGVIANQLYRFSFNPHSCLRRKDPCPKPNSRRTGDKFQNSKSQTLQPVLLTVMPPNTYAIDLTVRRDQGLPIFPSHLTVLLYIKRLESLGKCCWTIPSLANSSYISLCSCEHMRPCK